MFDQIFLRYNENKINDECKEIPVYSFRNKNLF